MAQRAQRQNSLTVRAVCLCIAMVFLTPLVSSSNITDVVFGSVTDVMPAAFGDFNCDELIDMIVLRDSGKTVEVLLASTNEPFLRADPMIRCQFKSVHITSLVPGDFDGDSQMDILVTAIDTSDPKFTHVYILWGGLNYLNCSDESSPVLKLIGQPLAIDYDRDNIIDLFGTNIDGNRTFWLFSSNRTTPAQVHLPNEPKTPLRRPHSHAFIDTNGDFAPDLILSTEENFEIWIGDVDKLGFTYNKTISAPIKPSEFLGQSFYMDVAQTGHQLHLIPACINSKCLNSTILVYYQDSWVDLRPALTDSDNHVWGFVKPDGHQYTDTITVRVGDFNMDGYFDIIATLQRDSGEIRPYLLENVECVQGSCKDVGRTFSVSWDVLSPLNNQSIMATFYDVYQDGVLDVILYGPQRVQAFKNNLDYDANFVKVMVGGRGGNLPGPYIAYRTTTQQGNPKESSATQLPQSAHFSLALPYVIFGLGRTPNFVDTLVVGVGGQVKEWTQIIPNSQMVVTWWPRWKVKLFVTPSKLIILSVFSLLATCVFIAALIGILYWKERREDRLEKLQEAHRFHFDAM